MTWSLYRSRDDVLRVERERDGIIPGSLAGTGYASPEEAERAKAQLEAAEAFARAVEDGQRDLFGGGE